MYNVLNKNEYNEYKYTERNDDILTHKRSQINNLRIWLSLESIRHSKILRVPRNKIQLDLLQKLLRSEAGRSNKTG